MEMKRLSWRGMAILPAESGPAGALGDGGVSDLVQMEVMVVLRCRAELRR